MFARQLTEQPGYLCARFIRTPSRLEAAMHCQPHLIDLVIPFHPRCLVRIRVESSSDSQRQPQNGFLIAAEAGKIARGDADHFKGQAVDGYDTTDDVRVRAKSVLPETIAQHDGLALAGRACFL